MVNTFQRNICWFEQWHLEVVTSNLAFLVLFVSSFARSSSRKFCFVFFSASYSSLLIMVITLLSGLGSQGSFACGGGG
jgi:hypothetical protein